MRKYHMFFLCMAMGILLCSCREEPEKQPEPTGSAIAETLAVLTTENSSSSEIETNDATVNSVEVVRDIDPRNYIAGIIEPAPDGFDDYVRSNIAEMTDDIRMQYTDGAYSVLKPFCIYELQEEVPVATGVYNYAVTRNGEIVGFISAFEADGELQYSVTLNRNNPLSRFLTSTEPENEKCVLATYFPEGATMPEYKWVVDEKRKREVEDEIVLVKIE